MIQAIKLEIVKVIDLIGLLDDYTIESVKSIKIDESTILKTQPIKCMLSFFQNNVVLIIFFKNQI